MSECQHIRRSHNTYVHMYVGRTFPRYQLENSKTLLLQAVKYVSENCISYVVQPAEKHHFIHICTEWGNVCMLSPAQDMTVTLGSPRPLHLLRLQLCSKMACLPFLWTLTEVHRAAVYTVFTHSLSAQSESSIQQCVVSL